MPTATTPSANHPTGPIAEAKPMAVFVASAAPATPEESKPLEELLERLQLEVPGELKLDVHFVTDGLEE